MKFNKLLEAARMISPQVSICFTGIDPHDPDPTDWVGSVSIGDIIIAEVQGPEDEVVEGLIDKLGEMIRRMEASLTPSDPPSQP